MAVVFIIPFNIWLFIGVYNYSLMHCKIISIRI